MVGHIEIIIQQKQQHKHLRRFVLHITTIYYDLTLYTNLWCVRTAFCAYIYKKAFARVVIQTYDVKPRLVHRRHCYYEIINHHCFSLFFIYIRKDTVILKMLHTVHKSKATIIFPKGTPRSWSKPLPYMVLSLFSSTLAPSHSSFTIVVSILTKNVVSVLGFQIFIIMAW